MDAVKLAVNGTLMRGFELNRNLTEVCAEFICAAQTAPYYRLWSINDQYPAMQRDEKNGTSIKLEVWQLAPADLVNILQNEPPGLTLGKVELSTGEWVLGVLGEAFICNGELEITSRGGWLEYIQGHTQNNFIKTDSRCSD
ncbi:MAG TPA: hypothetical protein PK040_05365 [Anaerolineaceae bacterium]|nr:hypothetical protein [Anaerolineaceae bacterium]